jgi:hypothetical protein
MTRKTIDYTRLGIEACEAYTEGPDAFRDFVRMILSIAAPLHVLQTAAREAEQRISFTPLSETRH